MGYEGSRMWAFVRSALDWREWTRLFFGLGQVKLPAAVLVIVGLFLLIPSVSGALRYWWDAAIYLGGKMGTISTILISPWFGLFLIVCGILYQIFVDENSRPVLRHKAFLLFGWSAVAMLVLTVFFVSLVSYLNAAIGPRHLYPMQKTVLAESLRRSDAGFPFIVGVDYVGSCFDCDGYAGDFIALLNTVRGWRIHGRGTMMGPSSFAISPYGVAIKTADISNPSDAAMALASALTKAGIKFDMRLLDGGPFAVPDDAQITISARALR